MDWISDPQAWTALVALTSIEIVLGIDNIVFISISVSRLPERQRPSVYFAMAFSVLVELLNMRLRRKGKGRTRSEFQPG